MRLGSRPLGRAAALDRKRAELAFERLSEFADVWHEIEPTEIVRESAMRFLRVHPLRAADALQLWGSLRGRGRPPFVAADPDAGRTPR